MENYLKVVFHDDFEGHDETFLRKYKYGESPFRTQSDFGTCLRLNAQGKLFQLSKKVTLQKISTFNSENFAVSLDSVRLNGFRAL